MSIIILFIFVLLTLIAIRFWRKKRRILSLLILSPLLLLVSLVGFLLYQMDYHTTEDSLQLTVQVENDRYIVTGEWRDRLEFYRFPADFLVFTLPTNQNISSIQRPRIKNHHEMDWTFSKGNVKEALQRKVDFEGETQIIDIKTDKVFQFSFTLPENVNASDVKLYYVHTREEPMDAMEFWFKAINLEDRNR